MAACISIHRYSDYVAFGLFVIKLGRPTGCLFNYEQSRKLEQPRCLSLPKGY